MSITSVVNDTVTSVSLVNAQKPLPPTISGYSVGGLDDTALDPVGGQTVQINGTGFLAGATITFDGSAVSIVTYVSPNQLTFTSPAKSAGTYTIYVVNPDGGTAIYIPGIIYSVLPTWTTSAGSLGSYYETTSISNTVVASGDAPITYSLYSGSLPTGSTLYANGVISGSAPVDSSSTTYSFTIEAIDAQLQGSTRSFSLTINTDVVTWVSPANATTYTSAVDSAIANVTLSATDAAGYAVSYSANALPTGLSLAGANISGTPTVIADSSTLLTATAATTNRTATRTINWSIIVANDPYFEYNTLLIPGASTTFVDDASTNNFAVTIAGDTKPNSLNPYSPGYYSNFFPGGGSRLSVSKDCMQLGTGDFTVECWVNMSSLSNGNIFTRNWSGANFFILSVTTSGQVGIWLGHPNSGWINPTSVATPIKLNTWHHLAVTRSGTSVKVFADGVEIITATSGVNLTNSDTTPVYIGWYFGDFTGMTGYISNLRVVSGTAVYTSAFTPPTSPLAAIAGTTLLTCQSNKFVDNSTNAYALDPIASPQVKSFQPFTPNSSYSTYGSGYFDGTGDYLSVASNALMYGPAFTLEGWFYYTAAGLADTILCSSTVGNGGISVAYQTSTAWGLASTGVGYRLTTTTLPTVNAWNHIVVGRSGTGSNQTSIWLNGIRVANGTVTDSFAVTSPFYIGWDTAVANKYFTGYMSDFRFVRSDVYGVSNTTITSPSAPLTAIANTSLLTLQNNQSVNNSVFLDNSTNNFLVTRNGNTTQGTFSPYGGNWSNYFNGSSDYLSMSDNAAFQMGTGDFTVEAWVNPASLPATDSRIWSYQSAGSATVLNLYMLASGTSSVFAAEIRSSTGTADTQTNGTTTAKVGVWYHVAFIRSSGTTRLFVNGVQEGTTRTSQTQSLGSGVPAVGYYSAGPNGYFPGYISNLRVVKGTAVYTSAFTPPTTPLTAISGTSLLTCQSNRLVDNSINNFTITKGGATSVQRFSPFNPSSVTPTSYSGYFDGTGDYLTVPYSSVFDYGTGDFTIEAWIYLTVTPYQGDAIFCSLTTGGSAFQFYSSTQIALGNTGVAWRATSNSASFPINTWLHVAVSRGSGTAYFWLNGANIGTVAETNAFNAANAAIAIGKSDAGSFTGYISNLRVVKGTAVYTTTFTPSTTPLTAISGTSLLTCQSSTFIDNSTNNFTITAVGDSQPTIQNPFGFTSATTNGYTVSTIGGSGYFDGTEDYLSIPNNTNWSSLPGNFTIECWFYLNSVALAQQLIFSQRTSSAGYVPYLIWVTTTTITMYSSSNNGSWNVISGATVASGLTTGQWYHLAFTRSGSTNRIFLNGVQTYTYTNNSSFTNSNTFNLGMAPGETNTALNGYISDARLINGTALYTSNFVPPAAPLTAVQNTSLLTNMTSAGIYDAAMINNMETVGDAKLSTAVSKFGGSSMSFDGTGDYLSSSDNLSLGFGSGAFTVEGWIYLNNTSGTKGIVFGRGNNSFGFRVGQGYNGNVNGLNIVKSGVADLDYCSFTFATNTWYHIAVVRSGTTIYFFVNGTQQTTQGSGAGSFKYVNPTSGFYVGCNNDTNEQFAGYIDDLRITKGYARYTSNFTPPVTAFPIY